MSGSSGNLHGNLHDLVVASSASEGGRLVRVLEPYAPTVPGFFLYYPSRAQRSPALRLSVDAARELVRHAV